MGVKITYGHNPLIDALIAYSSHQIVGKVFEALPNQLLYEHISGGARDHLPLHSLHDLSKKVHEDLPAC